MKIIREMLNVALRLWRLHRPDPVLNGCLIFAKLGFFLMIGGGFGFIATLSSNDIVLNIDATANDVAGWVAIFGVALLSVMVLIYFVQAFRMESKLKTVLFFYPGFETMHATRPLEALPLKERKALPEDIKPFDSYDKSNLKMKLRLIVETLEQKNTLNGLTKGYFAVAGSIPFLYGLGTIFNDGKVTHELLRHSKDQNKWEIMDLTEEENIDLIYEVDGVEFSDMQSAINSVVKTQNGEVGLVVSFTQKILPEHLPQYLSPNNIVHVRLNRDEYNREAIITNHGLDKVASELDKLQGLLSARSKETKIFLSVQSGVAFRFGMAYQPGMSGTVSIYNFNSYDNRYAWALSVTPDKTYTIINEPPEE